MVKSILKVILGVALLAGSFYGGRTTSPHLLALNPLNGEIERVPIVKDTQIFVIGPSGPEAGVAYAHNKDNSKMLVVPGTLMKGDDNQNPDEQQAPAINPTSIVPMRRT